MEMKNKIMCFTFAVIGFIFFVCNASLLLAEVKPGDVIDKSNWEKAKDNLPPEVLDNLVKNQGMKCPVEADKNQHIAQRFWDATKKYAGTITLDNITTNYVAGRPFPNIDPKDPQAGIKIAWNAQFTYAPEKRLFKDDHLFFVTKDGALERKPRMTDWKYFYTNRLVYPPVPNPDKLICKEIMTFTDPKDCAGIGFLDQKYLSEKKDNDSWAYVPSLRRVKRMSGAMRTDAYMGSDYTIEDFYGYQGKVTEFDWKLIGEKKILMLRDANPSYKLYNYYEQATEKYKWHNVGTPYQLRDSWVVEHYPKLKSHPYSKRVLYYDKEWNDISWAICYDKQGKLWKTENVSFYFLPEHEWFICNNTFIVDLQAMHGTMAPCHGVELPTLEADFFTIDTLEKGGH